MRSRILWGILMAACAVGPFPVRAEATAGGPDTGFKDALLEKLAGDWRITRRHDGETSQHTLRAEWVLQHQFLQLHMKHAADPPEYEAVVLIGYDPLQKHYVAHWCDTFGGQFSALGTGRRTGDAIEFAFQYPDGPFYNTFTWDPNAKGWTFRGEASGKDGKRVLFAEDTVRRPRPAKN
jgi:hypothetical protein